MIGGFSIGGATNGSLEPTDSLKKDTVKSIPAPEIEVTRASTIEVDCDLPQGHKLDIYRADDYRGLYSQIVTTEALPYSDPVDPEPHYKYKAAYQITGPELSLKGRRGLSKYTLGES